MESSKLSFNIILLGTSGIVENSTIERYCNDTCDGEEHKTTLGFNFLIKTIDRKNRKVFLDICDTAGQEQYRAVIKMSYRGSHGVFFVYDTTSVSSFKRIKYLMTDINENSTQLEQKILVGIKSDLKYNREVGAIEAKTFATENKMDWIECSDKFETEIDTLFNMMVDKLLDSYDYNPAFRDLFEGKIIMPNVAILDVDKKHRSGYKLKSNGKKKKSHC